MAKFQMKVVMFLFQGFAVLCFICAVAAPKAAFPKSKEGDTVPQSPAAAADDEEEDDEDETEESPTVAMAEGRSAVVTKGEAIEEGEEAPGHTVGGWFELRPSWTSSDRSFHSENEVALEYRFSPTRAFGYTQEFRTNILKTTPKPPELQTTKPPAEEDDEEEEDPDDPDGDPLARGRTAVATVTTSQSNVLEFQMGQGYFWGEFGDIVSHRGSGFSLSWEPRLYLPTFAQEREAGFVAATRQYLKLNFKLSPQVSLFLWEIPIFYGFRQSGHVMDDEPVANPKFENRVELGPRISLFNDRLRIKVPLILQSLSTRNFDGAAENNNRWVHYLWINPEAVVQITDSTAVGLSYYSDSLMDDRLKVADVGNGFRKGVLQAVFQQAF